MRSRVVFKQLLMKLAATSSPAVLMKPAHSAQPCGGCGSTNALCAISVVPCGLQSMTEPFEHGVTLVHAPPPHIGMFIGQTLPHAPQFFASPIRLSSQPLAGFRSQSP